MVFLTGLGVIGAFVLLLYVLDRLEYFFEHASAYIYIEKALMLAVGVLLILLIGMGAEAWLRL